MKAPTYVLINYGCQMNEHDSEIMEGLLVSRGWVRAGANGTEAAGGRGASSVERADLYVRSIAQEHRARLLERYDHLDLVIGTRDYVKLPDLVELRRNGGERMAVIDDIDKPFSVNVVPVRQSALKAYVTIMYGCDNLCAFCIVPQTRGHEWSRPLADIVAEARALAAGGYREIMLLGQNVNSYRDPDGRDFADVLYALNKIDGLWRIRYTTSNPKDCSDRHIRAVAECAKVCENLHLPVQSGSNSVLARMRRSYTRERYLEQVAIYREGNPISSLTTDLIVGFCGESDEEFADTLDLAERVRWDSAFMFAYSPRPGTYSATHLPDDVPHKVKLDRLARLIRRQEEIGLELNRAEVGRVHEVLVEGAARRGRGCMMGRTRTDKVVVFSGGDSLAGQLVRVKITEGQAHTLFGEVIGNGS